MTLRPSLTIERHLASKAYAPWGISGTSPYDPLGAIRSSRGFTRPEAVEPPTRSWVPEAARVTGSIPRGRITLDQVSVRPFAFGPDPPFDAGCGVDVHPAETSRVATTMARTHRRQVNTAITIASAVGQALGIVRASVPHAESMPPLSRVCHPKSRWLRRPITSTYDD
jgi:hypothetical protein